MQERRKHRSNNAQQAISFLLDAVRERESIESLALTTDDGLLVSGSGPGDLEEMGALGAASNKASFANQTKRFHVSRLALNNMFLCLTCTEKSPSVPQLMNGIGRILE
jgi:hypothetical protein